MLYSHAYSIITYKQLDTDAWSILAGTGATLMRQCIEHIFDLTKDREQGLVSQLLVVFVQKGALSKDDLLAALHKFIGQLEDLRYGSAVVFTAVLPC